MKIKIESIHPSIADIHPPEGYLIPQEAGYYKWLNIPWKFSVLPWKITVPPAAEIEIPLSLKMPQNVSAGNYFFLIKAEISKKGGKTKIARYIKVFAQKN
jgi:hypothetical protein